MASMDGKGDNPCWCCQKKWGRGKAFFKDAVLEKGQEHQRLYFWCFLQGQKYLAVRRDLTPKSRDGFCHRSFWQDKRNGDGERCPQGHGP